MKPILLDLFCGAGGCARGYQQAGFYVAGVDIKPQPRYAGNVFVWSDALEVMRVLLDGGQIASTAGDVWQLSSFAAIHASPPCQAFSNRQRIQKNEHPELIEQTRKLLQETGKPYVIENVPGAPLINPAQLVGSMFGLRTMRPRLFESNIELPFVLAPPPAARHAKMGRKPKPGEYVHVVGHMSDTDYCRAAMETDWMTRNELAQAIPPAYTRWIGERLMESLQVTA